MAEAATRPRYKDTFTVTGAMGWIDIQDINGAITYNGERDEVKPGKSDVGTLYIVVNGNCTTSKSENMVQKHTDRILLEIINRGNDVQDTKQDGKKKSTELRRPLV
eukprot:TRINITY_DN4283_c0_g1_i1.p2 TRINITY_DN4283_c0_g1~~TRINITY_DN4283_c0_g1_i1.p2  ORF type:complete len:106 (+),score=15.77 TRINITY_DN4283_c0_g1_i1:71-388(+)